MKIQPYYIVRNSKIHGRGVFAKRPIRKGIKVLEYTGDIISDDEAEEVESKSENGHGHTMLFSLGKNKVINGNVGGDAKYVNHSCSPNCETVQDGDKIFIESLRSIKQGEELTYDYHLEYPGKITEKVKKEFACFCGSPNCRGTQISAELLKKQAKKDEAKRKAKEEKAKAKEMKKLAKAKKKAASKDKKKSKNKDVAKKDKKKKKNNPSTLMVDTSNSLPKNKKEKKDKKKGKKKK